MDWRAGQFAIFNDGGSEPNVFSLHIESIDGDCAIGEEITSGAHRTVPLWRLEPVTEKHLESPYISDAFGQATLRTLIEARRGAANDD